MNRLVIIGNGFDLAHGLPTSYRDFIDDYSRKVIDDLKTNFKYEDNFFKIKLDLEIPINSFDKRRLDSLNSIKDILEYCDFLKEFHINSLNINRNRFVVKNDLFMSLCELNTISNWVDIENEYYKRLKDAINPQKNLIKSLNSFKNKEEREITKLNNEFENIKLLLEKYLEKINSNYYLDFDNNPFLDYLCLDEDLMDDKLMSFLDEFSFKEQTKIAKENIKEVSDLNIKGKLMYVTNYFLNFNYTSLVKEYFEKSKIDINHHNQLHGEIMSSKNPMNFGFGDEMDINYKAIEGKVDNEYLKNIKSFHYLNTPNYKNLLDFIDSDKFQVYLMGHSCGLSDRTLLNTIFEHQKCRSIKVFYHKRQDGTDNYTEIIQNISRHFNDKKLMRSKIVNKTLCQPLPQIKLPKKG